jgi:hypothetical protein
MKIDKDKLPTEVWHINRERIRKGLGVQRLEPKPGSWWHSALGHSTFHIKGRRGVYHSIDCYATQEEAWFKATGILRRELRDETTRHCGVMERLKEAENALKGVKE